MPLQQFDERVVYSWVISLDDSAVPGTYTDLQSTSDKDVRHDAIQLLNLDTIDHNVAIASFTAADSHMICEVTVPAGSGTGVLVPFDWLGAAFPAAFHYWIQASGTSMYWCVREAINAGKLVVAVGQAGGF